MVPGREGHNGPWNSARIGAPEFEPPPPAATQLVAHAHEKHRNTAEPAALVRARAWVLGCRVGPGVARTLPHRRE